MRVAAAVVLAALAGCGGASDESAVVIEPTAVPEPTALATETIAEPTTPPTPQATPAPEPTPEPTPTPRPTLVPVDPVVFQDDFATSVGPIFADKCASCHNAEGPGAVHWQLETAGDLVDTHEWISSIVDTGYMPPWPASDQSMIFHDNRSLRSDEIQAIAAWSAAGAPLDVEPTTPIIATQGVIALDYDVEIAPVEPYQGSTDVVDDYRCLVYDPKLTEERWLQGFEFVPDQTEVVHHAVGFLAPASVAGQVRTLAQEQQGGGYQCYGGSSVSGADDIFLGWAPGQLPTQLPEGSGMRMQPGDFIIMQVHYHYDLDAPEDASTLRLDWADGTDLDPIEFGEYVGPAEIPCSVDESGPLCDRDTALARAYRLYGVAGVQADSINAICGVTPEDFAAMTTGIASSACQIRVRNFGEIVSVFGHEHEIGKSFRMTLNAGQSDEQVLLDIPEWSFDWQYNYYPLDSVVLEQGDTILLECAWDRSLRPADLEPAYVLWADGTNDEMCFATIATRQLDGQPRDAGIEGPSVEDAGNEIVLDLPDGLESCMAEAGFTLDEPWERESVDAMVDALFTCAEDDELGESLTTVIADNFGGLVGPEGLDCLSGRLSQPDTVRDLLIFGLEDSTDAERLPVGELVGDCVALADALRSFGLPIPEARDECINTNGRELLVQATVDGELPAEQTLLNVLSECLTGN